MPKGNGVDDPNPVAKGKTEELICGIIMPISAIDGTSAEHWAEVKTIITESVDAIAGHRFTARLVSDADEVGVIQKRIIQNVYNCPIVVCDVSGKNPNVMFELGLRLAFDKPTVIIKDDKTDYAFDTGVIEHVGYPRDLRFGKVVEFKTKLANKLLSTYNAAISDPKHSPFLRSFGQFHVASLPQTEVSPDKLIMEALSEMQRDLQVLKRRDSDRRRQPTEAVPYAQIVVQELKNAWHELGRPATFLINDGFMQSFQQKLRGQYQIALTDADLRQLVSHADRALRAEGLYDQV